MVVIWEKSTEHQPHTIYRKGVKPREKPYLSVRAYIWHYNTHIFHVFKLGRNVDLKYAV